MYWYVVMVVPKPYFYPTEFKQKTSTNNCLLTNALNKYTN